MKNIQIIDGADNCTFSIFQATDDEFALIFPGAGQDIEFSEDFVTRVGEEIGVAMLSKSWERPVLKSRIAGLHGTLFYEFEEKRKHFPTSKREVDWDRRYINSAQRALYEAESNA